MPAGLADANDESGLSSAMIVVSGIDKMEPESAVPEATTYYNPSGREVISVYARYDVECLTNEFFSNHNPGGTASTPTSPAYKRNLSST